MATNAGARSADVLKEEPSDAPFQPDSVKLRRRSNPKPRDGQRKLSTSVIISGRFGCLPGWSIVLGTGKMAFCNNPVEISSLRHGLESAESHLFHDFVRFVVTEHLGSKPTKGGYSEDAVVYVVSS